MIKFKIAYPMLLAMTSIVSASSPTSSIVVDGKYSGEPGASINGKTIYKTVGEALRSIQGGHNQSFVIYVRKGIYREKISVDIDHVHLIGEDRDSTIITYDATADSRTPDGKPCGTQGSFTLRVTKTDFHAENLTIENSFDYPGNDAKLQDDPTKIENPQAVAVMTAVDSDRTLFRNCVIKGYQDTLFPNAGRHYFHHCNIFGHVDFIFGAGQAVFDGCDIISRNRENKNPTGYITAPSTLICDPYGFLFVESRLLKETLKVPAGSVRLGRPWHPNADLRAVGSAVFVRCYMDDHIGPIGYAPISSHDSTGQRIWFDLEMDSRLFEYESYGPGAINSSLRPVLNVNSADWYKKSNILNGWIPETGE